MAAKEPQHNIIIYLRCSTEEQDPMLQLRECESIRPKQQNMDTFVDYTLLQENVSAWQEKDRPVFNQIKKAISQKKVRDLIVWDLDRLYRNRTNLISFFEFCRLYGCRVHSFRQQWLNDINNMPKPFNEIIHGLMLQIMGWLSEEESDKKSKRIKAAVRKKGGITRSYRGNRWGRKPLSTFKRNKIRELNQAGLTVRGIGIQLGVSKSVVHKTIQSFDADKKESKLQSHI